MMEKRTGINYIDSEITGREGIEMELYKKKAADLYETSISNITPTINPVSDTSEFGVGVSASEKDAGEIRFDDYTIILCCSCRCGSANKKNYY